MYQSAVLSPQDKKKLSTIVQTIIGATHSFPAAISGSEKSEFRGRPVYPERRWRRALLLKPLEAC
jgi:hypothetical protein